MKGASKRGRGPWRCRLAPQIRSFPRGEWIPGQCPCASEEGGAGAAPQKRASVVLTHGLELGPLLSALLRVLPCENERSLLETGVGGRKSFEV
jgi:hypothetical protein